MPDWSYQTIFKLILFQLPSEIARDFTFTSLNLMTKLPFGYKVIEIMGQMTPPASLQKEYFGVQFLTPVGLGSGLDAHLVGMKPLSKFGFGFMEIGPITLEPVLPNKKIIRDPKHETIIYPSQLSNDGVDAVCRRLQKTLPLNIPIGLRISHVSKIPLIATAEKIQLMKKLQGYADFFIIDTLHTEEWTTDEWTRHIRSLLAWTKDSSLQKPLLVNLMPYFQPKMIDKLIGPAIEQGIAGIVITDHLRAGQSGFSVGKSHKAHVLDLLPYVRSKYGKSLPIIVSGGIHEPKDALRLLRAGANLIQLHSGLIFSGPGLPKRINEALLWKQKATLAESPSTSSGNAWISLGIFGLLIFFGGILAVLFALTTVILPYDEAFLGMMRHDLHQVNEHLVGFMSHDRLSLSGTMISSGILYWQLAYHGVRKGIHWARQAVLAGGIVGFLGFFTFLGYGYFDPLHALFFALLLPPFVSGVITSKKIQGADVSSNVKNHKTWHYSQWGQLMFVSLGMALTTAGVIISFIGVTEVFVPEDLAFMGTTRAELQAVNDRLVPMIAHDRAGFGSALISNGLLLLLLSLWGFRENRKWVWYTLFFGGLPGFAAGFGAHLLIGYNDLWHLFPAFIALAFYVLGLVFSYSFLCGKHT